MNSLFPAQPAQIGHNQPPVDETEVKETVLTWLNVKHRMGIDREEEKKLRQRILDTLFKGAESGTKRYAVGPHGWFMKAIIKFNYTITKNEAVDPPDYSHLPGILAQLPRDVAETIIRWKPEISESAYKKLSPEHREIVNRFLVITNGASQLELEPPKAD